MKHESTIDEITHPCVLTMQENGAINLIVQDYGIVTGIQKLSPQHSDKCDIYIVNNQEIKCYKSQRCYLFNFNNTQRVYKFINNPGRIFDTMLRPII